MDHYAFRLAQQAVRVNRAKQALDNELEMLAQVIKGTPPTITSLPEDDLRAQFNQWLRDQPAPEAPALFGGKGE